MLRWLRQLVSRPPAINEVSQPPDDLFEWPAGASLTATNEEIIVALPRDLVGEDEPLGAILTLPAEAQVGIAPQGDVFYIRLGAGMTAKLARGCHAYLVAESPDDNRPRRLKWMLP
jgi:hypothetical protein